MKKIFLTLALMALCSTASFADITPAPEISFEWAGTNNELNGSFDNCYFYDEVCVFYYLITATGEGDVHLYLNGEEVANPYYYAPEAATGYMQFMPKTLLFTATAQSEGCEMSETTKELVRPGIPRFTIYHDEESDSFWMVLESDDESSIRYKTRFVDPYDWTNWIDSDWEDYSGPFKVWYAPQPRHQHCVIEVMTSNPSGSSDMGIIMELQDEIDEFGIYGYDYYDPEYGFYCKQSTNWDLSNIDNREGICNKYINPESHAPCYSGDLIIPDYLTVIHKKSFVNCPGLTSIVLPNSDLAIGQGAFAGCTGLESITCKSVNPPSTSNSFADESIFSQATLFVPYESLEAYKAHEEWGKFLRIVPFRGAGPGDVNGDGTLSIGDVTDIINQMLNGDEIPPYCDVNGDGNVTISDVTILTGLLLNSN